MPTREDRDFPIWTNNADQASFQTLLAAVGSVEVGTRQAERIVSEFPGSCLSGGVEAYLKVRVEQGISRGAHPRPIPAMSGYVTIDSAVELVDRSRATIHGRIRQGQYEAVTVNGRTMVSLASMGLEGIIVSGEAFAIFYESSSCVPASDQVLDNVHGMFTDFGGQSGTERDVRYKQAISGTDEVF